MRHLLLPLLCWPALAAFAQQAPPTFSTVDAAGAPIPYVNVYVPAASTGTVSALDGTVRLPDSLLTAKHADTELRFSAIGYRDTTLAMSELPGSGRLVLAEATYELAEAEVVEYGWGKPERLGRRARSIPFVECYAVHGLREFGVESAIAIESDRPCRIDNVYLQSQGLSSTEATLEINFYTLDGEGLPDEPIQRAPIRRTVTQREARRTIKLGIEGEAVVARGDFAVSIELVDASEPDAALWLHMFCNPRKFVGRARTKDGRWTYNEDGLGFGVGAIYLQGRCAQ